MFVKVNRFHLRWTLLRWGLFFRKFKMNLFFSAFSLPSATTSVRTSAYAVDLLVMNIA